MNDLFQLLAPFGLVLSAALWGYYFSKTREEYRRMKREAE